MSSPLTTSPRSGALAGPRFFCLLLALLSLGAGGAAAHDFWIEPTDFAPEVGRPVGLGLFSGDGFQGRPVPRDDGRLSRFSLVATDGERPVEGAQGVHPAGFVTLEAAGPHWVVLETRPRRLELSAPRFEKYLREEGLERVIELRRRRGDSDAPGREGYRRCAKTLLEAGGPVGELGAGTAGCPLELVLEMAPVAAAASGRLAVRLLYEGRPLAGARVAALRRAAPERPLEARTDDAGRVSFALGGADLWLLKAVHMEPASEAGGDVDWRSWWASLTVRLPAAEPPPAP